MKKQYYFSPVVESITIEIENGIASSGSAPVPADYGTSGAAGAAVDEIGATNW